MPETIFVYVGGIRFDSGSSAAANYHAAAHYWIAEIKKLDPTKESYYQKKYEYGIPGISKSNESVLKSIAESEYQEYAKLKKDIDDRNQARVVRNEYFELLGTSYIASEWTSQEANKSGAGLLNFWNNQLMMAKAKEKEKQADTNKKSVEQNLVDFTDHLKTQPVDQQMYTYYANIKVAYQNGKMTAIEYLEAKTKLDSYNRALGYTFTGLKDPNKLTPAEYTKYLADRKEWLDKAAELTSSVTKTTTTPPSSPPPSSPPSNSNVSSSTVSGNLHFHVGDKVQVKVGGTDITMGGKCKTRYAEGSSEWGFVKKIIENYTAAFPVNGKKVTNVQVLGTDNKTIVFQVEPHDIADNVIHMNNCQPKEEEEVEPPPVTPPEPIVEIEYYNSSYNDPKYVNINSANGGAIPLSEFVTTEKAQTWLPGAGTGQTANVFFSPDAKLPGSLVQGTVGLRENILEDLTKSTIPISLKERKATVKLHMVKGIDIIVKHPDYDLFDQNDPNRIIHSESGFDQVAGKPIVFTDTVTEMIKDPKTGEWKPETRKVERQTTDKYFNNGPEETIHARILPNAPEDATKLATMLNEERTLIQNDLGFPSYSKTSDRTYLIPAKYDYRTIIGDPSLPKSVHANLEDQLEKARAALGIPVHGSNDMAKTMRYFLYNRYKTPDTNLAHNKSFTHVFFTRPDLNIINPISKTISNQCRDHTESTMLWMRNPALFQLLVDGRRLNDANNFNMLLSNAATSFAIEDENLTHNEHGRSWQEHAMQYGDSWSGRTAGEFSVNFTDDKYYSIIQMIKLWITYIDNVSRGAWKPSYDLLERGLLKNGTQTREDWEPRDSHVFTRTLDYASSAYVFKIAEDGSDILYWTKYYGVFPLNTGSSALSWDITTPVGDAPKLNIRFRYSYKRDMSPISLLEFNHNARIVAGDTVTFEDDWNANYNHSARPYVGTPFVSISLPSTQVGIVNNGSKVQDLAKLRLRFRPDVSVIGTWSSTKRTFVGKDELIYRPNVPVTGMNVDFYERHYTNFWDKPGFKPGDQYDPNQIAGNSYQVGQLPSYATLTGPTVKIANVATPQASLEATQIRDIVAKMKEASAKWWEVGDAGKQFLSDGIMVYANQLTSLGVPNLRRDLDGVWWTGNQKLYELYS